MLTSIKMEQVLTPFQCQRIRDINRKVGPVELYRLKRIVSGVAQAQGREIHLPENGYRSVYSPAMLDVPMEKFLAPFRFTPDRARLTAAVSRVRRHLAGMGKVKPVTLDVAHEALLHTKENNFAGLPTMGKKSADTDALVRAKACERGKCPPPVVIGHRGKNTVVARPVWMFPFEWHICEAAYFLPLQEKFKRNVRIYAASNAVARRAKVNELLASGDYQSKLAMDYSGFDGSIGPQMIGIAFNLLHEHLVLTEREEKLWRRVAAFFATSPFINQHGELISGRKGGVPSGSMFTQMIDTIVNAIVIEYCLLEMKNKKYLVYGDDSLTLLPCTVVETENLLADVKRRASELGVTVNLEKTHVCVPSERTTFLGHYDLCHGRPVDEVLARLIYPEKPFQPSAEHLRDRLVSYMAESDEVVGILMPVIRIIEVLDRHPGKEADFASFARNYYWGFATVGNVNPHPRDLPGLAQFLCNEDPTLASSYMRIRAAV